MREFSLDTDLSSATVFIINLEGFEENAYRDSAGIWTIGYGFITINGNRVKQGDKITQRDSDSIIENRLRNIYKTCIENKLHNLNVNQTIAILSFIYNVGRTNFLSSAMFRLLKSGDLINAAQQFERWVNVTVNGVKRKIQGLVNRRKIEKDKFLSISA